MSIGAIGRVEEWFAAARERGLKLAVITNGENAMQRRKMAAMGVEQFFDAVLVSEDEGVRKPDAEIFRRALARCGVAAHEAVFVGDHPVADVEGAQRAGLTAVWKFVPYWQPVVATTVIRDLSEVLSLLGPPSPKQSCNRGATRVPAFRLDSDLGR